MPPVNTKEKMPLHLVSRPSDLSTAGIKDKELFIHNTLHRDSPDRAIVKERMGRGEEIERGKARKRTGVRKNQGGGGREEERKRLVGLCIKGRTVLS